MEVTQWRIKQEIKTINNDTETVIIFACFDKENALFRFKNYKAKMCENNISGRLVLESAHYKIINEFST